MTSSHPSDPVQAGPLVQLVGINKHFGAGPAVLDDVDLTIAPGEVHGLLGANGSGKSTLIKILSGVHGVDSGTLTVRGEPAQLPLLGDRAQALGLRFVHQDLGLVGSLSALENYLIPLISASRGSLKMNWRAQQRRMQSVLDRYGLAFDPQTEVALLRPVDRALLAIVRALDGPGTPFPGPRLVVLDEPTVFLPQVEIDKLFSLIRRIAADGSSVLFVSHDLDEVRAVTDRITVLRNGAVVLACARTAEISSKQLIKAIVGAELASGSRIGPPTNVGHELLRVSQLTAGAARGVDFTAYTGEVIGLTGLSGDGYEDIVEALAGAIRSRAGQITLAGSVYEMRSWNPTVAVAQGVVLVPADRLVNGIAPELPLIDNVTLPQLNSFLAGPLLRRGAMRTYTQTLIDRYDIRPTDPDNPIAQLSGGNQQKAVLGKWIETAPKILLLHEPTQGVDVGARQQIFRIIRETAEHSSVLVASSDHDQLAELCDRVLIVRKGNIVAQLTNDEVTKSRITAECLQPSLDRASP